MDNINLKSLNLFISSICNSKCRNCFYKSKLNKRNDLSFEEIKNLSKSLGKINVLNISGGEPFLKREIAEIYRVFLENNKIKVVSIPTNGLLPDLILKRTTEVLEISKGKRVVVCISLDGTEKMHDLVRGVKGNFKKVIETYKNLKKLKKEYPNFSLRINTVIYENNYKDLFDLFSQISRTFPLVDAVTLGLGRPVKFGEKITLPEKKEIIKLFLHKEKTSDKKRSFARKLVERMVFIAALERLEKQKQTIPCLSGEKEGVVYANGDVGVCEMLPEIGNIRKKSFEKIWRSKEASKLRSKIKKRECFCTHEGFIFQSILNQPRFWPRLVVKSLFLNKGLSF